MKYTSRIKIICNNKSLLSQITYDFINQTTNKNYKNLKLDTNWCSAIYECNKNDIIYFIIKINNEIYQKVRDIPKLNGKYTDSVYYLKSVKENKVSGQQNNKNGNPIFVLKDPYSKNKKTTSEKVKAGVGYTSQSIGVLRSGLVMYDNDNFYWGMINAKNPPDFGWDRIKQMIDLKRYKENNNGKKFHENQHRTTNNIGKSGDKAAKLAGNAGDLLDTYEVYDSIQKGDAKAVAEKSGEIIGGKVGDAYNLKLVGKCTAESVKGGRPTAVAGRAASCMAASYMTNEIGKSIGKKAGQTDLAIEVGFAIIEFDKIYREQLELAEKNYFDELSKTDPGIRDYNLSSD